MTSKARVAGLARLGKYFSLFVGRGPTSGIVFHHVPKCAGTAVREAINVWYLPHRKLDITSEPSFRAVEAVEPGLDDAALWERVLLFRKELLHFGLERRMQFVHGHVPFSGAAFDAFRRTHRFVTVMRDPVGRFISNYFYSARSKAHDRIAAPLDETFVETQGMIWGATYARFFADLPAGADLRSREAIEAAKHNLGRLDLVGFDDDMPSFTTALGALIGVTVSVRRVNVAPATVAKKRDEIAPDLLRSIREACAPDIEIFEAVRAARGRRMAGVDAALPRAEARANTA